MLIGVQDLLDMWDQTGDQTPLLNFRNNGKQRYGAIIFNQIFFALFVNGWDIQPSYISGNVGGNPAETC